MTRLHAIYVFLCLIATGMVMLAATYGIVISEVHNNQRTNTYALCHLRSYLQGRVNANNILLLKNPSSTGLRTNISSQQHTVDALSIINCQ